MEAVELGLLVLARVEAAEEDVAGAVLGQGRDPEAAKEVVAVGRHADADLHEVLEGERGEVMVAQVGLDDGRGPGVSMADMKVSYEVGGGVLGTYDGLEVLLLMLVVLVAEVDKLLLEGVLELLEGLDGLVLGSVRGREFDSLCGGLRAYICELLALVGGLGAQP